MASLQDRARRGCVAPDVPMNNQTIFGTRKYRVLIDQQTGIQRARSSKMENLFSVANVEAL